MKNIVVALALLVSLSGCKETKQGTKTAAADTASTASSALPEQGPCYKYMHCQADSEINYSGIPKNECLSKGGKSWKGEKSGCQEL